MFRECAGQSAKMSAATAMPLTQTFPMLSSNSETYKVVLV